MSGLERRRIIVIGDVMLDRFVDCVVRGTAQEAPVDLLDQQSVLTRPGGAARVAEALIALGAQVDLFGLTGADHGARELSDCLSAPGLVGTLVQLADGQTLTKTRYSVDKELVLRVDAGLIERGAEAAACLAAAISKVWTRADAVIFSDYDYGMFSDELLVEIKRLQDAHPKLIAVDSRHLERFADFAPVLVKPNASEASRLVAHEADEPSQEWPDVRLAQMLRAVSERTNSTHAVITLGSEGAVFFDGDELARIHPPRVSNKQGSGAGDAFLAAAVFGLCQGQSLTTSLSNATGVAAATVEFQRPVGVEAMQTQSQTAGQRRSPDRNVASNVAGAVGSKRDERLRGRVVFTNGCFDVLHVGHLQTLQAAKKCGDILVVGLNTDSSITRLKGASRPVHSYEDRARMLHALSCVDDVIALDEDEPSELISRLQPDVFVKAGYRQDQLPELSTLKRLGVEIVLLPTTEHSTSAILETSDFAKSADASPLDCSEVDLKARAK